MNKIINFEINECIEDEDKILQLEELCQNNLPLNIQEIDILLKKLSYLVRKKIANYEGINMNEYSYSYKCDLAQSMICNYLSKLSIKVNPVNTNEVINGVCGHSFVIAFFKTTVGEKIYLLDPTYLQFFSKENCDISKYVIIEDRVCISPDPGFFVVQCNNQDVILPLLKNGYIEFTEEVAKVYGDSFFQTKQGVPPVQVKSNVASGSTYINWFQHTSKLSKTEEELANMDLSINLMSSRKEKRV